MFRIVDDLIGEELCDLAGHVAAGVDRVDHVVEIARHRVVQPDSVRHAGRHEYPIPVASRIVLRTGVPRQFGPGRPALPRVVIADSAVELSVRLGTDRSGRPAVNRQRAVETPTNPSRLFRLLFSEHVRYMLSPVRLSVCRL